LGEVLTERRERPSDEELLTGRVRIVSKIGFNNGQMEFRSDGRTRTGMILIRPGDLVVSGINAAKGAIAVYGNEESEPAAATIHYGAYELDPQRVHAMFLWWLLRSGTFRELLREYVPGGIKTELKARRLLPIPVPLPPLPEQRHIVARIEELAGKVRVGKGLLVSSIEATESVPVSARYAVFTSLRQKELGVRLDTVAETRLGKMLSRNQSTDPTATPYLRNANVQWDRLDLRDVARMSVGEADQRELALEPGDILVCEGGDIGKAAMWNGEIPGCIYQKALHRIRVNPNRFVPRFLLHQLFWAAEQGHWADVKTQTTIAHLTGIKLKAHPVIVPPLDAQRRIAAELDALQTKVDELKRLQAETQAELDALLPSILDRAFRGEL